MTEKTESQQKQSLLEFRVEQLEVHVATIMETLESLKGGRKRKSSKAEKEALKNELLKAGPYDKAKLHKLDFRTSASIGSGYQFLETERTSLSLEAGISYVNEDYIAVKDNAYTAGRWGLRFEHFFLKKALQIPYNRVFTLPGSVC